MVETRLTEDVSLAKQKDASVPKTQKTFFLPTELCEVAEAYERLTGVNFTRQVGAAMLQYFFDALGGPDERLIEYVVAIEQGRLTPLEVPVEIAKRRLHGHHEALRLEKKNRGSIIKINPFCQE